MLGRPPRAQRPRVGGGNPPAVEGVGAVRFLEVQLSEESKVAGLPRASVPQDETEVVELEDQPPEAEALVRGSVPLDRLGVFPCPLLGRENAGEALLAAVQHRFHVVSDFYPLNEVVGPALAVQPLRPVAASSALRESSKVPLVHFLPVDGDRDLDPCEAAHVWKRPLDTELLFAELGIGDDVFLDPGGGVEPLKRFRRTMGLGQVAARGGVTSRERNQNDDETDPAQGHGLGRSSNADNYFLTYFLSAC